MKLQQQLYAHRVELGALQSKSNTNQSIMNSLQAQTLINSDSSINNRNQESISMFAFRFEEADEH